MTAWTLARLMLTVTAAYGGIGSYIADWNRTHIHNPDWPPHAKFHNAQSMSLGAALMIITVASMWRRPSLSKGDLRISAALASTYCATQISALLYPGTALIDPPTTKKGPQAVIAAVLVAANIAAYAIGARALTDRSKSRRSR